MKEFGRSIRECAVRSLAAAAVLTAWLVVSPAAAGAQEPVSLGCIVRSIDLDSREEETLLRIRTEGDPSSLGARLETDGGVVLDLSGCAPAPELSGHSFADGLVSSFGLVHDSDAPGLDTSVVVQTQGPFEYSVSSGPGSVLMSLRRKSSGELQAEPKRELARVLEPLPIPVEPAPPAAEPPSPASQPEIITPPLPPAPDTSVIAEAVTVWTRAWSDQQVDDYLAAYASDFQPPQGLSRPEWEAQRRQRLTAPSYIEVTVDALQIRILAADRAVADFRQSYLSDTYGDQVYKTLVLIDEDGRWRILLEEAGVPPDSAGPAEGSPSAAALVEGARSSIADAPRYDASYCVIDYPRGDPGPERGSAVDVVIRAYRHLGIDLQVRIHEDILAALADYGLQAPDANIDHRRIRNQQVFFERHSQRLPLGPDADWQPGDIVFWALDGRRRPDHVGIVSDLRSPEDRPLVIHHQEGATPSEEDLLFAWTVRGHYRWLPATGEPG